MNPRNAVLTEDLLLALPLPVVALLERRLPREALVGRNVGELEEALRRMGFGELGWLLVAHVSRIGVARTQAGARLPGGAR